MKRILFIALFAMAGPSFLSGQHEGKTSRGASGSEQEIKNTMDQVREAQIKGDTATLDRLLADDYSFTNSRGELRTKAQTLSDIKSGAVKYQALKRDELNVRIFGDVAVANGRVTVKGQRNGQDISGQYRGTWVWVNRGGRWQAVSGQTTPVAGTSMAGTQKPATAKPQPKSKAED